MLRAHQIEPFQEIRKFISGNAGSAVFAQASIEVSGRRKAVLTAVTGFGKTFVTCMAIADTSAWVVVDQGELIGQWFDSLLAVGVPIKDIGIIWAGSSKPREPKEDGTMPTPFPKGMNLGRRIQIVMVQTLAAKVRGTKRDKLDDLPAVHYPKLVVGDELHELCGYSAYRKLCDISGALELGLTATPGLHPLAKVPFIKLYPVECWIRTKSAAEMIAEGLWKTPKYIRMSQGLAALISKEFSGIEVKQGEYDTTKQRDVFMRSREAIIDEWEAHGAQDRVTAWACVDTTLAAAVAESLRDRGYEVGEVYGTTDPKERRQIMARMKAGTLKHGVFVGCFKKGVDVPIASAYNFLLKLQNPATFYQMTGRVFRPHDDYDDALIFDWGLCLSEYPPVEECDWFSYNPSKRSFHDVRSFECQQCRHRHSGAPKPLHPTLKTAVFNTTTCEFSNGDKVNLNAPLVCHKCAAPVYMDQLALEFYVDWVNDNKARAAADKQLVRFPGDSKGWSIGEPLFEGNTDRLTAGALYDVGIWAMSDEERVTDPYRDKSETFQREIVDHAAHVDAVEMKRWKSLLLPQQIRSIVVGLTPDIIDQKVRAANNDQMYRVRLNVLWAYYNNKCPATVVGTNVTEEELDNIERAFVQIIGGNHHAYELLMGWLVCHLNKQSSRQSPKKARTNNLIALLSDLEPLQQLEAA